MCWHLWNTGLFLPLIQRAVPCRFVECLFEEYGLVRWRVGSPLRRQTFCSTQRTISYVHAVSRVCVGIWLRCPFLPKSRRQTITSYLETFVLHSQLLGIVVGDCNTHCQECHILCSSQAVVWIYIQLSWDPNLQGYFWIVLNLERNLDPHKNNKTVKQDCFIFVSLCVI